MPGDGRYGGSGASGSVNNTTNTTTKTPPTQVKTPFLWNGKYYRTKAAMDAAKKAAGVPTTTPPKTGSGISPAPATGSGTTPPPTTPAKPTPINTVVAGVPTAGQANVADVSGAIAANPALALNESTTLNDKSVPTIQGGQVTSGLINPNDPDYAKQGTVNNQAAQATTATQGAAAQVGGVQQGPTHTYTAQTTQNAVANADMTAAQGQVSDQTIIDENEVPQIDIASIASGFNPDGTVNATGQALQEFASLDLNQVDPRATAKGQLEALQADFTGPNGEPKIPIWAQANARSVGKIAAFKGVTGTAAVAAMATAMMEASIPVAMADAQFYQTVSLQNLNNEQQAVLNRANVLSKFELTNADNRMAAAIQNAQSFLAMDMKNLDNEQQARVINNQNRVQSILEDAKAVNTQRMFTAQSQNDMDKFYDELNTQIKQYNATQVNNMRQFNASETNKTSMFNAGQKNDMIKFNTEMNNQREQFYKTMQYNIDVSNAKWRQTVTLTNADMKFQAAATDVKNRIDISQEALNRLWDRSDALLDMIFKGSENSKDRANALLIASNNNKAAADAAKSEGWGSVFGTIAGPIAASLTKRFLGL